MPTTEEKIARIHETLGDRISRLEDEQFEEGVPNPLLDATDVSRSTEQTAVASESAGSMQWGDLWGASEWNPSEV